MAGDTVGAHLRHGGVDFVVEMHRLVEIGKLREQHRVGGIPKGMSCTLVDHLGARAGRQTWFAQSRNFTSVALIAVDLGQSRGTVALRQDRHGNHTDCGSGDDPEDDAIAIHSCHSLPYAVFTTPTLFFSLL